ncbi:MAG: hypothetical protein LBT55_03665 [Clostridiaceae bacterium]|jgi:hypothetical protein|nr:hypothetical protein [Clostridiaceae bacterium]
MLLHNSEDIYKYWFKEDAEEIIIICSKEPNLPKNAYVYSNEYQYINNMADKDLLMQTQAFLCKYYPNAKILTYYPYQYRTNRGAEFLRQNLVLLGGSATNSIVGEILEDSRFLISQTFVFPPSTKERFDGRNEKKSLCKDCNFNLTPVDQEFNCRRSKNYCQPDKVEIKSNHKIVVKSGTPKYLCAIEDIDVPKKISKKIKSNNEKLVICDYGMFAAFDNSCNSTGGTKRIVLVSGTHSSGALCALDSFAMTSRAQGDSSENERIKGNYEKVKEKLGEDEKNILVFAKADIIRFDYDLTLQNLDVRSEDIISLTSPQRNTVVENHQEDTVDKTKKGLMASAETLKPRMVEHINWLKKLIKDPNCTSKHNEANKLLSKVQSSHLKISEDITEYSVSEAEKICDEIESFKEGI